MLFSKGVTYNAVAKISENAVRLCCMNTAWILYSDVLFLGFIRWWDFQNILLFQLDDESELSFKSRVPMYFELSKGSSNLIFFSHLILISHQKLIL